MIKGGLNSATATVKNEQRVLLSITAAFRGAVQIVRVVLRNVIVFIVEEENFVGDLMVRQYTVNVLRKGLLKGVLVLKARSFELMHLGR